MAIDLSAYRSLSSLCKEKGATLVAVSKTKPVEDILELYNAGQRDFGENYVQELVEKQGQLPADIRWHFIGHLQSNKVKQIIPFVHLIHGVDGLRLLQEINKQAGKISKQQVVLLQVHIASEDTKFGMDEAELEEAITATATLPWVQVKGLMGMASFTDDQQQVREEFRRLQTLARRWFPGGILSMGMSGDYTIALEEGSNLLRIGSMLFGAR